mmetsp:Transcript_115218/g.161980  ORF Transcript_115218/g.161980 Transcript_115218/m.161980 type:complete len:131 (+) Transcript_115218:563-955(+)
MGALQELQHKFAADADFLCVYIAEAHASDEWPMGEIVSLRQARKLDDRLTSAREFIDNTKFTWNVACDGMDNSFNKHFGAWPTRFFVVEDNRLTFKVELDEQWMFNVNDVDSFLGARVGSETQATTTLVN